MSDQATREKPKRTLRDFAREIIVGVITTFVSAAIVTLWPTLQALTFPDFVSGDYILLGPEENPGKGPDVIYLNLNSYNGRVWGSMSQKSKRWSVTGYWKSGYLVFSYRSDGNGLDSIGFGEQIFTPIAAGPESVLVGEVRGNYCVTCAELKKPEIRRCPNVMVKGGPESVPDAIRNYAPYLGTLDQCPSADIATATNLEMKDIKHPAKP